MNKRELVAEVTRKSSYAKWEIDLIVDHFLSTILETLKNGEEIKIANFGNFNLKYRKSKINTHPITKKKSLVSERGNIVFKQTRTFKLTEEAIAQIAIK